MKNRHFWINTLICLTSIVLAIITIIGVQSFDLGNSFFVSNIYGQSVELFGSGIYFYDSYFKAPIFMGSDFTMLVVIIPILIGTLIWYNIKPNNPIRLFLTALMGVVFYYAISISTGVTYNNLFLLYILLVIVSWISIFVLFRDLNTENLALHEKVKGYKIFLIITGIALFSIWLMDIIPALLNNTTLLTIENYTTEVTYVYDMAFISPIMFLSYYLIQKKDGLGTVLLACMLVLCTLMGIMLPIQTIFQSLAHIVIPMPVLIIKVGIFVLLACFSAILALKLFKSIK